MALWKLVTLITAGLALLWQTRPAYGLAYLFLILFFALQYWKNKAAAKITVERQERKTYFFSGDEGEVLIRLQNRSSFSFPWISILDRVPRSLVTANYLEKRVLPLARHQSKEFSFPLIARRRGVYLLGPLEVFVGDLFGISTERIPVDEFQTVIVYPKVSPLNELSLPSRLSFGHFKALHRIYPDPTRLAGVRPYQQGDPLRTLHWPATARTSELQVKQFDHTVTVTGMIYLDLDKRDYQVSTFYSDLELAVSTAASLAAYLLRAGEACGLATNAVLARSLSDERISLSERDEVLEIQPRQGTAQLTRLLTILAGVKTQGKVDFLALLRSRRVSYRFGSIMLWVVPKDSAEIVAYAKELVALGHHVQIFVAGSQVIHPELLHRPKNAALQMFSVIDKGAATA